jgi:hypothetical protein
MRFKGLIILIVASFSRLNAQTENEFINQFIERYIENTTDEVDIQQFTSDLVIYLQNPLDLNKATASELLTVPFFSSFQVSEILEHRKTFGNFISIYELQVLPSFGTEVIKNIIPFISLKTQTLKIGDVREIWEKGSHQFLTLTETSSPRKKGALIKDTLTDLNVNHYLGSSVYNNLRYRFDYGRLVSYGVNMEKDAYESFLNGNNPLGYDYFSYYFSLKNMGKLKSLQLGDYQASFGQGLTLNTGIAFGKSSIITNAKRNFNGFGAYRSLRENAFLRGIATTYQFNRSTVGAFVSYKKLDGNGVYRADSNDLEGLGYIISTTNIQEDGGLHRTPSELTDKDAIKDFQTGIFTEYSLPFGKIGAVSYLRRLNQPLEPIPQVYNRFNFRGNQYLKNGIYYDFIYRNLNLFGEISMSSYQNSFAQVHGALISLGKPLDISLVYRNYGKSFITMQSTGFGESGITANENGLYVGFESKLSRQFTLLGYYDLFQNPWLRSATDAPSSGSDFWSEIQYKPTKVFQAYYRYRTETKQRSYAASQTSLLQFTTTQRHRFHINYTLNKGIELRSRIESSIFATPISRSYGSMIYQDFIYKPMKSKLQLSGRIAFSNIENFNNRIYSFEQVPLYDYPLFTHGYSGLRYYLLTRYTIKKEIDIWFRYAINQLDIPLDHLMDNFATGSGLDEINSNIKQTFTLQIRYLIP